MVAVPSDTIQEYLAEIDRIPMLSRQEELATARCIERSRKELRRLILGNGFVVRFLLKQLKEVESGELRIEHLLDVPFNDVQQKRRLRKGLAGSIRDIERRTNGCRNHIAALAAPATPFEDRRRHAQEAVRNRSEAAEAIERVEFRMEHLEPLLDRLGRAIRLFDKIARRRRAARSSGESAVRTAILRQRRRQIIEVLQESP